MYLSGCSLADFSEVLLIDGSIVKGSCNIKYEAALDISFSLRSEP